MNRWAVAFPVVGVLAALLVLAPSSTDDFPRTLLSLGIVIVVAVISFGYVWLRSRGSRARAAAVGALGTVSSDPDSLELAAHIAGVDAPRAGTFALVGSAAGIQMWSTGTDLALELPWSAIRSVDLDPSSLLGASDVAIAVYTEVSPRIAIRLVARRPYGVGKPTVAAVGTVIARLRELQANA
jgi:hypothetical protein